MSQNLRIAGRIAAYAWAAPNSLLGLFIGLAVLAVGGRIRLVRGAVEFSGKSSTPTLFSFGAITFGHIIIGASKSGLEAARPHEHVHVAQYEVWGPFFLPAYAASSVWQALRGRHVYWDNFFEKQAYAQSGTKSA